MCSPWFSGKRNSAVFTNGCVDEISGEGVHDILGVGHSNSAEDWLYLLRWEHVVKVNGYHLGFNESFSYSFGGLVLRGDVVQLADGKKLPVLSL